MTRPITARSPLTDGISSTQSGWNGEVERRRSPRAALHWTVYLTSDGANHPLRTESRDISRDGFYCLVPQPISPGVHIKCYIVIPTHNLQDPDGVVYLRCNGLVVRVERLEAESGFGLACRLEDYSLVEGRREGDPARFGVHDQDYRA